MPADNLVQARELGPAAGLPRPRSDGIPIPWITRIDPDGPAWAHVDTVRLLQCQTDWLCQVCGQQLPRQSWVVLEAGRAVLSDAAMHAACVVMALRWCPYLADAAHELETVEVEYSSVHADGTPLDTITDYGDEVRTWTVPNPLTTPPQDSQNQNGGSAPVPAPAPAATGSEPHGSSTGMFDAAGPFRRTLLTVAVAYRRAGPTSSTCNSTTVRFSPSRVSNDRCTSRP